jgi:glycosyltransferase involved in cell wall biosynthesis
MDVGVFVFSLQPYGGDISKFQKDPSEWVSDMWEVYYSKNTRETVTDEEIRQFVAKHEITHSIIPETCWFRVFEMAQLFASLNVKCFAIPNIEIVRRDEMFKHRYFYKILCNNALCKQIFDTHGFGNTELIGYCEYPKPKTAMTLDSSNDVSFICLGGMNAFSRKRVDKVCESFVKAHDQNPDIRLTVTVQGNHTTSLERFKEYDFITVIEEHLSYSRIMELYAATDVTIHVSSHEGLGIGFYESLSHGIPVVTLDTAPHNEIVKDGVSGWTIPCFKSAMVDNNESFLKESHFEIDVLAAKLASIRKTSPVFRTTSMDFQKRHSPEIFAEKFRDALAF